MGEPSIPGLFGIGKTRTADTFSKSVLKQPSQTIELRYLISCDSTCSYSTSSNNFIWDSKLGEQTSRSSRYTYTFLRSSVRYALSISLDILLAALQRPKRITVNWYSSRPVFRIYAVFGSSAYVVRLEPTKLGDQSHP